MTQHLQRATIKHLQPKLSRLCATYLYYTITFLFPSTSNIKSGQLPTTQRHLEGFLPSRLSRVTQVLDNAGQLNRRLMNFRSRAFDRTYIYSERSPNELFSTPIAIGPETRFGNCNPHGPGREETRKSASLSRSEYNLSPPNYKQNFSLLPLFF